MRFEYNDGGRKQAGFKGKTGDCVVRAVAIALELDYLTVYDLFNDMATKERRGRRKKSNSRTGVRMSTCRKYLVKNGWQFVATMGIGTGCRVHLKKRELPGGRLIVRVSRHLSAVIDGVVHDTHDPSREGTRCVYGYFIKTKKEN